MGQSKADEKILSFNDVVLRRSDLEILRGPHYLNDRIIEFYFSYLSSNCLLQDILLVSPSISFWITNCLDYSTLKDFIDPLKLPERKIVIFTVNDNDDVDLAEGGTHWSLLAYVRETNMFVHHDSFKGLNGWHARKLYRSLTRFVGANDSSSGPGFVESATPQQRNSYDCGLYVLAIAKVICDWHASKSPDKGEEWFSYAKEQVERSHPVSELRSEILRLIQDLMNSHQGQP